MKNRLPPRLLWSCCVLAALLLLDSAVSVARHHSHAKPATGVPGQFDYYVLTLSWSPSYCLTHQQDRAQCGGRGYGFVLHGLWPQFDAGGWPQNCSSDVTLPPEAAQIGRSLYPSASLMQHEWERHGTCSGMDAATYFRTADQALSAVHIPANLETPGAQQSLSGAQIAAEFRRANPSLPGDGLTVACSRGELSEVRVCLTRSLAPRSCGPDVRSTCPANPVDVPATRGH